MKLEARALFEGDGWKRIVIYEEGRFDKPIGVFLSPEDADDFRRSLEKAIDATGPRDKDTSS